MKKKNLISLVGVAAALAFSLSSISCGDDNGGDDPKAGEVKPPEGIALGKQVLGTWAPDPDAMVELAKSSRP